MKAATLKDWKFFFHSPISIHAAREGGDYATIVYPESAPISIHAAREGGDKITAQPLMPLAISIHAAREGGDRLLSGG